MAKITTKGRIIIAAIVGGGALLGLREAASRGLLPGTQVKQAVVPQKANLPDLREAQVANVTPAELPSSAPASVSAPLIRGAIWAWNAQMGLLYANGGAKTAKGSLMEKRGVNLLLYRQDDTNKMQEELISCAKEVHDGAQQCSNGANFVIIMGDGSGQFLAGVNAQLKKLGPEWAARVIGSVGYSRGEDCFMAPPEVKSDPQKSRGLLVAGVLRDGDWNIAMKWAADNGIPNNPDEKTWDPNALNWVNSPDYIQAAQDYIAGKCEDRSVVKDGHLTGEKKKVCVNGTVTWTPGDVNVVKQKGGLAKVVSSKEYRSQMPAVILGPKAFFEKNRNEVQGMLAAAFEGADQVKAFDQALKKAADVSAKVYNDQDGAYWYRYFKGVVETDAQGNKVALGGSAVNNLADNLILFGMQPGTNDNFRSTYTLFANIVLQQYPELFKDTPIPEVKDIEDKSFIAVVQANATEPGAAPDVPEFTRTSATEPKQIVSKRSYQINFDTGKSTLTPDGQKQLRELKDSIAITQLYVKVDGFTDNQGSDTVNVPLSEERAQAVKMYLQKLAPNDFKDERFQEIAGHGSKNPVAPNSTPAGRARNRRVEITLLGS